MKSFEEFLKEGVVKKIESDFQRSIFLIKESQKKFENLQKQITQLGVDDTNANDFIEYCYNVILTCIRSHLYAQGFKCIGKGAHIAEISFLNYLNVKQEDIFFLDELRQYRNGILYYGEAFDAEYAEKVIRKTKKIYSYLLKHDR